MRKSIRSVIGLMSNIMIRAGCRLFRFSNPSLHSRRWSNSELKKIARLASGQVINVSGWRDSDKEGGVYRDYFSSSSSYVVSNIEGYAGKSTAGDIFLDLEMELPSELIGKYDVVFNHTTLEHVYDADLAFNNLCRLAKDLVIIVVPFMQVEHWSNGSFSDYSRFTEFRIRRLFEENGLTTIYLSSNHNPCFPIYYFAVGSRNPSEWSEVFKSIRSGLAFGNDQNGNEISFRGIADFEIMK